MTDFRLDGDAALLKVQRFKNDALIVHSAFARRSGTQQERAYSIFVPPMFGGIVSLTPRIFLKFN